DSRQWAHVLLLAVGSGGKGSHAGVVAKRAIARDARGRDGSGSSLEADSRSPDAACPGVRRADRHTATRAARTRRGRDRRTGRWWSHVRRGGPDSRRDRRRRRQAHSPARRRSGLESKPSDTRTLATRGRRDRDRAAGGPTCGARNTLPRRGPHRPVRRSLAKSAFLSHRSSASAFLPEVGLSFDPRDALREAKLGDGVGAFALAGPSFIVP